MTSLGGAGPIPAAGAALQGSGFKLIQVNLQSGFGGGEVYTGFFGRALRELGVSMDLVVHRDARWWRDADTGAESVWPVGAAAEVPLLPFRRPAWVVYHTPGHDAGIAELRRQGCGVACFAHMPLYQRSAAPFLPYDRVFAVSQYVLDGLRTAGIGHCHDEALYGVAATAQRSPGGAELRSGPLYDWDLRKGRDRILSWLAPLWRSILPTRRFERRPGLSLGVVSRITTIKQFPLLFRHLVPVLLDLPQVHVDVFGSGGYASVRDLKRALAPLAARVRYWGHQSDVGRVYRSIDYLLTGLPEKEALGLNVIEAQACGTPVLAPHAPPFTETVLDGSTGFLYPDPRGDGAEGFRRLIQDLVSGARPRPDPRIAAEHLAKFSAEAFRQRVRRAVLALDRDAIP